MNTILRGLVICKIAEVLKIALNTIIIAKCEGVMERLQ